MFYEPEKGFDKEVLTHNPFPALVAPRPIAWITSQGTDGRVNLAPYSHFNLVSVDPPMVMFAPSDKEEQENDAGPVPALAHLVNQIQKGSARKHQD